jgi:chemotaxis protein MotB
MAKKSGSGGAKKSTEIPAWMPSFTDMVTLLFCFFVLLFAMAEIDPVRMRNISEQMNQRIQMVELVGSESLLDMMGNGIIEVPDAAERIRAQIDAWRSVEEELIAMESAFKSYFGEAVFFDPEDNVIVVVLTEASEFGAVMFDSGSAVLRQEAFAVLDFIGGHLLDFPMSRVVVEGHTDNIPINTARFPDPNRSGEGNLALSAARAFGVANYFVTEFGYNRNFIDSIPRGEWMPIADNATPEGRAQNRRVEIRIYLDFYAASS